ncbi:hypothetical protein C8Q73DRAFT_788953 [Cubamyces lactineus]|nr:hypothetical protein C8Q73DRAFT_788953 [Cubamyces lactineus]
MSSQSCYGFLSDPSPFEHASGSNERTENRWDDVKADLQIWEGGFHFERNDSDTAGSLSASSDSPSPCSSYLTLPDSYASVNTNLYATTAQELGAHPGLSMSGPVIDHHNGNPVHSGLRVDLNPSNNPYGSALAGPSTAGQYQWMNCVDGQDLCMSDSLPLHALPYPQSMFLPAGPHAWLSSTYAALRRVSTSSTLPQIVTPSDLSLPMIPSASTPPGTLTSNSTATVSADINQGSEVHHGEREDLLPETQPIAGPSRLPAAPTRRQPLRSAKRKHEGDENTPVAGPSAPPKRQRRAGPTQPPTSPTPTPDSASSSRTRRTKAELERAVMPSTSTRCGLGGCNFKLYGDQDEVRAHARSHYPHAPKPVKGSRATITAETKRGKTKTASTESNSNDSDDSDDSGSEAGEDAVSDAEEPVFCSYEAEGCPGQQCGKVYKSVLGLSRHLEHEHYGWKFPCPKCKKLLARRDAVRRHLKKCKGPKSRKPSGRR